MQSVYAGASAVITGNSVFTMPGANTLPPISSGDQYMDTPLQPMSATSVLDWDVHANMSQNVGGAYIVNACLFRGSAAIAYSWYYPSTAGAGGNWDDTVDLDVRVMAGVTTSDSYTFRMGVHTSGGSVSLNGRASTQQGGAAGISHLRGEEIAS